MPSFDDILSAPSIFADRNVLSPHFVPEQLPFREKEIERIMVAVAPALADERSRNLFIYGKTGTGKTCTVRRVMLKFEAQRSRAKSSYINCRMYNSRYRVIQKLAKDLNPELDKSGFGVATLYEKLVEYIDGAASEKAGLDSRLQPRPNPSGPAGSKAGASAPAPAHAEKAPPPSPDPSSPNTPRRLVVVLDEVDMVRDLDELLYTLTRMNDELVRGSISILGITNRLSFKEALDPRSKSSLCETEMVFVPYTTPQLEAILIDRAKAGFKPGVVDPSALGLAAAIAAQETGDARYALKLLLKAGEISDEKRLPAVTHSEVEEARRNVDVDLAAETIATLPAHQQLVLLAVCNLTIEGNRYQRLGAPAVNSESDAHLMSGEVYEEYSRICRSHKKPKRSARWYREYLNDLEMLGLITTIESGRGMRGHTRLIKPGYSPAQMKSIVEKGRTIDGPDDPLPAGESPVLRQRQLGSVHSEKGETGFAAKTNAPVPDLPAKAGLHLPAESQEGRLEPSARASGHEPRLQPLPPAHNLGKVVKKGPPSFPLD